LFQPIMAEIFDSSSQYYMDELSESGSVDSQDGFFITVRSNE